MSNGNHDPRRRILDEFGADDEIVGIDINYSLTDLKLFVPAMVLALLIVALSARLGGRLALLGGTVGACGVFACTGAIIYITPEHTTPQNWLARIWSFTQRTKTKTAVGPTAETNTESITQIARFVPEANALERRDGTLVGALTIEPANMALATDEEWNQAADTLGSALNTLDFSIQIHSSARSVDSEQLTAHYRNRLEDADVAANPSLKTIIEVYQTRRPAEFRARATSVREYHVLVPVSVRDVQLAERGAFERLTSLPYLGELLAMIGARQSGLSESEITQRQRETLETRLDAVQGAIGGLEDCATTPISTERLATLIEEFWTGRRTDYPSQRTVRSTPIVTVGEAGRRS